MPKDPFGEMKSRPLADAEALRRVGQQTFRLMTEVSDHAAIRLARQQAFASTALLIGQQMKAPGLSGTQSMSPFLQMSEQLRPVFDSSRIRLAAQQAASLLSGPLAARDQALFARSTEMFQAVRNSIGALNAAGLGQQSAFRSVLEGIRLDQERLNQLVQVLATATVPGLALEEAAEVGAAFEEAVAAQVSEPGWPAAEHLQFSDRMLQALEAHLAAHAESISDARTQWYIGLLVTILIGLIGLAQNTYLAHQSAESDRRSTKATTSRQDEINRLIQSLLDKSIEHWSHSVPTLRVVDRAAKVRSRPRKGAAVIAVVPRGGWVTVVKVRGKWLKVVYQDTETEATRTGWVLQKYIGE